MNFVLQLIRLLLILKKNNMTKHICKIDKLISEMCPNGVPRKELWELTAWDKKFNGVDREKQKKVITYRYFPANRFKELVRLNGTVRLLSTGNYIDWTDEEFAGKYLCEGEIVAIPWGGQANVKYYNGKFVTADNRIATSLDANVLLNKFLYYWMLSQNNLLESFYRGAGIKHPSMKKVLEMKIPLPPLVIQKEIVKILNSFTELESELESGLEARRKQYEYYRSRFLTFEDKGVAQWVPLNQIINFMNGKGHEKHIDENGKYIVINSKFVSTGGRVRKHSVKQISPIFENDILMVMSDLPNGKALAKCFYVDENDKYTLNQRICALSVKNKEEVDSKYLFYILNRNKQLLKYDNGTDQTNLRKDDILNIEVPVPEIIKQKRIVSILDKFDALVNDISIGLPAELKARKQQYEYYRNKLLTFKEYVG